MSFSNQSRCACNTGTVGVTTQYDAAGRVSSVTDAGGRTTTHAYIKNDVLVTTSPGGPTRQYEYDGLGRLTSVCEVTGLSTNGCAQSNTGKKGFFTAYTYDALGNLTGVTQNANGSPTQTRSYQYDGLSRLTYECNPETGNGTNGSTTYFWDAAPAACYNNTGWPTAGDLGAKKDNAGIYTCYAYDALHRLTGVEQVDGTGAQVGGCTGFSYDSKTPPTGVTVQNTKGRLIEAYTNNDCKGTQNVVTDEWFGYSTRGDTTDVYSSTVNSNGYYHLSKQYWANGAPEQISSLPGMPTINYGVDGEGRLYSVSDSTNGNLVTQTTYNAASQVSGVTFGNGDSDSYGYDTMGRMNGYTFNLNGSSVAGTPSWNANATLGSLNITDAFNSNNTQNCTYGYDDMARISSVSCNNGQIWSQTFTLDPFGNLSKSGTSTFQPTYNSYNQYASLPGCTPKYDSDGRLVDDSFHTYHWDTNSHVTSLSPSACLPQNQPSTQTFDAFGKIAEINQPGWLGQYIYDTDGRLLGSSHTQSAASVDIRLPGGSKASYGGGVLGHYRHTDWLGTMRFDSNVNRSLFADVARAPYGEEYAVSGPPFEPFAELTQSIAADLFDTQNREYHPVQGRWISPDPAGLAGADPANPQTWNRYAYVLNIPLSYTDPRGLWCVWEDGTHDADPGDGGFSADECARQGGHWDQYDTITGVHQLNGDVTQIDYSAGGQSGSFDPIGMTLSGFDQTLQTYSAQNTTVSVGQYWNYTFNPEGHIAIGVGGSVPYGENPRSTWEFAKYKLGHRRGGPGVPGVVKPQIGGWFWGSVTIPVTGFQAQIVQNGIIQGIQNPPNYDIGGGPYTCDCASWPQQVLGAAGVNSGPPTQMPDTVMDQLYALYPQLR